MSLGREYQVVVPVRLAIQLIRRAFDEMQTLTQSLGGVTQGLQPKLAIQVAPPATNQCRLVANIETSPATFMPENVINTSLANSLGAGD